MSLRRKMQLNQVGHLNQVGQPITKSETRVRIVFEGPDFGVCKDCGNPLFMLSLKGRHDMNTLIAACPRCDVVR